MSKTNRGFTLIELLVVIAIIGILSSVVLASLTSARSKGQDSAVQQQLSSMRAQAELFYSTNNNQYHSSTINSCSTGLFASSATGGLKALKEGAIASGATIGTTDCYASTTAWLVKATLPSGGNFCVDSFGNATSTTNTLADGNCVN